MISSRASLASQIRAGVSAEQLVDEFALRGSADDDRFDSWGPRLDKAIEQRVGELMGKDDPELDDAATLGALLSLSGRRLSRSAISKCLDWRYDRVDSATTELSLRLRSAGMGVYVYLDESLQVGPVTDQFDWRDAQDESIALEGTTFEEAVLVRHLLRRSVRRPLNGAERPQALDLALKAGLVHETSSSITTDLEVPGLIQNRVRPASMKLYWEPIL